MFYHIGKMTKMTMKLLLRNKGFLFFAVALPILATVILNIRNVGDAIVAETAITELSDADDKVAYLNDYKMLSVKVYDSSDSEVTLALLNHLAEEGLFQIYRVDVSDLTADEILESAKRTALKDKIGAVIVVGTDIEDAILKERAADAIHLYRVGEDERYDLLESSVETLLTEYTAIGDSIQVAAGALENEEQMAGTFKDEIVIYEKDRYQVQTAQYAKEQSDTISSLDVSYEKTDILGYTFAILSLSFLFSGIIILGTIMKEKQNLVYTRIMLTKAGAGSYLISKFLVIILVTIFQTAVTGMAFTLLVRQNNGISLIQFMFLTFLLGIIFNVTSVCVGVCCGSLLSAAYVSFYVWVITALLGGLYFDISSASDMMQRVAMLMPQRWMLKSAQMMMNGNNYAYSMILAVTAGYLIVIVVIGMLGLNINRKE